MAVAFFSMLFFATGRPNKFATAAIKERFGDTKKFLYSASMDEALENDSALQDNVGHRRCISFRIYHTNAHLGRCANTRNISYYAGRSFKFHSLLAWLATYLDIGDLHADSGRQLR